MSKEPEEIGPGSSGDMSFEPVDSELVGALDQLVDALQAADGEARTVLLTDRPELSQYVECLIRLDALFPFPAVAETGYPDFDSTESPGSSQKGGDRVGTRFGRYELVERIGHGAMGVVYLARQTDLDRIVALKLITPGSVDNEVDVARFYSEARAAARLRHPGIVGVLEVGDVDGQHFIAMDYVSGGNLSEYVRSESLGSEGKSSHADDSVLLLTSPAGLWRKSAAGGAVEPDTAAGWMAEISRAVDYLHNHGIIHRDLKPGNILLDDDQRPLVTDFGLALVHGDKATKTTSGAIVGTPAYMAPEQAGGHVEAISPRSDIFSLGVMLYELLTGRAPFQVENPLDTLVRVIEVDPEPPTAVQPWLSRELEHICLKCLEKDPRNRYHSAVELADDLERYLRRENVRARPAGVVHRVRRWGRRQPVLMTHLVALGLVAGINQLGFLFGGDAEHPAVHLRVMAILAGWAAVSGIYQWLMKHPRCQAAVRFFWCATDAALLTSVLAQSAVPPGPLLVGYALLIAASGLFFRVRLVWFMTLSCVLAYAALLGLRQRLYSGGAIDEVPWQYPILFAVVLAVLGMVIAYQVFRVRVLNRYYRRGG